MNIVVIHQSRSGNTKKAAELIGGAIASSESKVTVRSAENLDFKELANADLIFVGTWVDGLILFGHRPGDIGKLNLIPPLWGKNVVAFMTHAANPGKAVSKFTNFLESKGAKVIFSRSINKRKLGSEISPFVKEVLAELN
ncbi:MAG: flavodoxin family protein [Acidimicrobiales bacterium]|jgi:flavodoxin|nr:MAG: hypothetical protein MB52_04320 [marine actinobacterium MedAcidi-G1]MAU35020.1 hypothetical protein [Actinomycetota bacterium]HAQ04797.1 hypothetical protein [Acidimicrobiaceae bacterium]|tara:strand:- start:2995 stop:3414 length:420 start_codon:yes stop_codon:yes gene_type:complete